MNIFKKLGLRAAAAAAGVLLAGAAQAAPVTYYFSGSFSLIVGAQAAMLAGQAFNGTLTYNPATAPSFSGGNYLDYFLGAGDVTVSTLLGTGSSNGTGSIRQVWNASVGTALGGTFIGDSLSVISSFTGNGGLSPFNRMGLSLADADNDGDNPFGANLSALPTNILLSELNGAEFRLSSSNGTSSSSAYGSLACLSTSSTACSGVTNLVPEPGSLALACVSLLGLFATSRRQSRNFSS